MQPTDVQAIQTVLQKQQSAMTAGDFQALSDVLDEQFTATHITGYRQPKAEWLAQIRDGYFQYHRTQDQGTTITVGDDSASVTGRTIVDVTIGGSRGSWRLETTLELVQKGREWVISHSRATTY